MCETREIILDERYDLRLSTSASAKELELLDLSQQDVGVYYSPVLPLSWDKMTPPEKSNYVLSNEFDLKVEAIYFRSKVTLEIIKRITQYTEIEGLHIRESNLVNEDIEYLSCFVNIDHLLLRGQQFTDDIVQYFGKFIHLENLDIFETSLSENGVKRLNKLIPNCRIWGP